METKQRVFSGIQPSGTSHLGNYLGAFKNWVAIQDEYENYFCIVDLHALTAPQDPKVLRRSIREIAAIYLAAGLDPRKGCDLPPEQRRRARGVELAAELRGAKWANSLA